MNLERNLYTGKIVPEGTMEMSPHLSLDDCLGLDNSAILTILTTWIIDNLSLSVTNLHQSCLASSVTYCVLHITYSIPEETMPIPIWY